MGHVLMENHHGLVGDTETTRAAGFAERLTALAMVDDLARPEGQRITLGADRAYDTRDFVSDLRDRCVTPHVAQNTSGRRSAIDGQHHLARRLRRQPAHRGGVRLAAGQGKTRVRALARVRFAFTPTVAAYNLIRLPRLLQTG